MIETPTTMPPSSTVRRSSHALALTGAITGALACGVTLALVGALETWINSSLVVPHALTGSMQSALFGGNFAGSLLAAWLMYHLGPRRYGLTSLALMLVGTLLSGMKLYEVIVLARFITGLGYSGAVIFFGAVIVHTYPQRQATYLNIYHAAFGAGASLTLLAARPIAESFGDWPSAFWIASAVCLIPLFLFAVARLPNMHEDEPYNLRAMMHVLESRVIITTFIVSIAYVAAEQALTVFAGTYSQKELGFTVTQATQVGALFWAGILAGRLISAAVSRKVSEPLQIIACALVMAGLMLTGMTARQTIVLYASTFLAGLFAGPVVPLAFSFAVRSTERLKSATYAAANLASTVGGVLGPVLVGAIGDRSTLERGLNTSAIILLASLVPFIYATVRKAGHTVT